MVQDHFFFLKHMAQVQGSVSDIRKGKPIIHLEPHPIRSGSVMWATDRLLG